MPTCVCILNTRKYNLVSPYNGIIMYVFKTDHLVLVDQLVCSSPGKTVSPILSIPQLLAVLCQGLQSCEPLPPATPSMLAHLLVLSLLRSCLGSYVGEIFMGVASDMPGRFT